MLMMVILFDLHGTVIACFGQLQVRVEKAPGIRRGCHCWDFLQDYNNNNRY